MAARAKEQPFNWNGIAMTVIAALIIAIGSVLYGAVTGHAKRAELVMVEQESKVRDQRLEDRAQKHKDMAEAEFRKQAEFRGELRTFMKSSGG